SSSVAAPMSPAAGMSVMAAVMKSQSDVSPRSAIHQLTGATRSRTLSQLPVRLRASWRAIDTGTDSIALPFLAQRGEFLLRRFDERAELVELAAIQLTARVRA